MQQFKTISVEQRKLEVEDLKRFLDTQAHTILRREFLSLSDFYSKESNRFSAALKHEEASAMAIKSLVWKAAANEAEYLVDYNESLLKKISYKACELCGNIKKFIHNKIHIKEAQENGGSSDKSHW